MARARAAIQTRMHQTRGPLFEMELSRHGSEAEKGPKRVPTSVNVLHGGSSEEEDDDPWSFVYWLLSPDAVLREGSKTGGIEAFWWIVEARLFRFTIAACVLISTVLVGVQVDQEIRISKSTGWFAVEWFFCAVFLLEAVLKILGYGWRGYFFDAWHCFDFAIAMLTFGGVVATSAGAARAKSVGVSILLRWLRIVRVARVVRNASFFHELHVLMYGLARALSGVFWAMVLFLLITYGVAVLTTELVGRSVEKYPVEEQSLILEHYGSVPRSLFTLFQIATLESWASVCVRPILETQPELAVLVFIPYILASAFGVISLITAIFTDRLFEVAAEEKERKMADVAQARFLAGSKLQQALAVIDDDHSGAISASEIIQTLRDYHKISRLQRSRSRSSRRTAPEDSDSSLTSERKKQINDVISAVSQMDLGESELFDTATIVRHASRRVFASMVPELAVKLGADRAEDEAEETAKEDLRSTLLQDLRHLQDSEQRAQAAEQTYLNLQTPETPTPPPKSILSPSILRHLAPRTSDELDLDDKDKDKEQPRPKTRKEETSPSTSPSPFFNNLDPASKPPEVELSFPVLVQGLLQLKTPPQRKDVLLLSAQLGQLREALETHSSVQRQSILTENARVTADLRTAIAQATSHIRQDILSLSRRVQSLEETLRGGKSP